MKAEELELLYESRGNIRLHFRSFRLQLDLKSNPYSNPYFNTLPPELHYTPRGRVKKLKYVF